MKKVITYGTYDLLHEGHIRLLKRAKQLGDYLIVGVTADDFDKTRGKINVQQSLMERVENVRATGLADEIIIEEYEGQKIDDIRRYDVDIFTVGSDWKGHFDYLNEFCDVVYLDRTEGISSSQIRSDNQNIKIGLISDVYFSRKYISECSFVNGIEFIGAFVSDAKLEKELLEKEITIFSNFNNFLKKIDAVIIVSHPSKRYEYIKTCLSQGKHVLCESPYSLNEESSGELLSLAKKNHLILMDSIKTAYSTAYSRLLLLLKSEIVGNILSVDATCTSLIDVNHIQEEKDWNSICEWGPTAMLPIFQILGINCLNFDITSMIANKTKNFDLYTKINFIYNGATASLKVGKGIKSEGELIVSGTKGYVYVPAPWWKTDYFEVRYENQTENKRYFYQLDGEGIRYELVIFVKSIHEGKNKSYIQDDITQKIAHIIESFYNNKNKVEI